MYSICPNWLSFVIIGLQHKFHTSYISHNNDGSGIMCAIWRASMTPDRSGHIIFFKVI